MRIAWGRTTLAQPGWQAADFHAGTGYTLEQAQLYDRLMEQATENPHKIDLTAAIEGMKREAEIQIRAD